MRMFIKRVSRLSWYVLYVLLCILILCFICEIIVSTYYPLPYRVKVSHSNEDILMYGFINKECLNFRFPPRQTSSEKRILFVGDSFVQGGNESFNTQFASFLYNIKHKYDYTVRYIATAGWGTDQEYIAFKNLAFKYKPDVVILAFCLWNDIANNLSVFHGGDSIKPYFILKDGELVLCKTDGSLNQDLMWDKKNGIIKMFLNVHYMLCQKSNFYFYLSKLFCLHYSPIISDKAFNIDGLECSFSEIKNYTKDDTLSCILTDKISHLLAMITKPKPFTVIKGRKIYIADYGYELTNAILRRFDQEIEAYGGDFYVLILPFANPFNWRSSDPEKIFKQQDGQYVTFDFTYQINKLKNLCMKDNINVIDFTDSMENEFDDFSQLIISVDDVHYNQKGNLFLAEKLYEYYLNYIEPHL